MSDLLPVVVKAQPKVANCSLPSCPGNYCNQYFSKDEVLRERLGWEERENALKSRIDEISRKLSLWYLRKPDDIDKGVSASEEELSAIIKELEFLGLSK